MLIEIGEALQRSCKWLVCLRNSRKPFYSAIVTGYKIELEFIRSLPNTYSARLKKKTSCLSFSSE